MSPIESRRDFRTDVQGLRAVAVGMVLLYHAGVPFITGGYVGVDVFFVISGFLISSHLLESLERHGRIRFGEFYARRIRRILPASLTVAILTGIAAVVFYPPLAVERVLRDGLATILYVPNLWFAIQQTDYLADHSPSPYQHYWSLGVEEQFYLLWPLLLMLLFVVMRGRNISVIAGISVVTLASLGAGLALTPLDQPSAFFLLPTRAWELLVGAVVGAVLLRGVPRLPGVLAAGGGWLGLTMIGASALVFDDGTAFPGAAALVPTVGTALVILFGASAPRLGPTSVLSLRPMQFIGLISYSLYLVHWPLLVVVQAAVGEQHPLRLAVKVVLGIVLAVPLAWLLFRFVETPLRSPRALTVRRPRVTLLAALGVTVMLAAASVGALAGASSRLTGSGEVVAAASSFPASPPIATSFVPGNMSPALKEVADDVAPVFVDGCQLDVKSDAVQDCVYGDPDGTIEIALFGDSHSAQWLPAVQEFAEARSGIAIRTYTKSSCSAAAVTILVKAVPYASCDRWREAVVQSMIADPPDVIVISNYAHYPLAETEDRLEARELWGAGLQKTIHRLRESGSQVLLIADSPRLPADPAACVSMDVADVSRCDVDREWALDPELAASERKAADAEGAVYVDMTRYICGDDSCPVIIDDLFVYRDVNHMTATFVSYLAPALGPTLSSLVEVGVPSAP